MLCCDFKEPRYHLLRYKVILKQACVVLVRLIDTYFVFVFLFFLLLFFLFLTKFVIVKHVLFTCFCSVA